MLPVLDVCLNQVNTVFALAVGQYSMLQITRGCVMVMMLLWLLPHLKAIKGWRRTVLRGSVMMGMLVCCWATREAFSSPQVGQSLIPYVQLWYWLVSWVAVLAACKSPWDCEAILKGLVASATIAAGSVWYGYVQGVGNFYADENIVTSSGFFNSGKAVSGLMIVGALPLLYFGHDRWRWIRAALAGFILSGCVLTYARAGMVALAGCVVWLIVWDMALGRRRRSPVSRLAIVIGIGSVLYISVLGTTDFERRWSDIHDPNPMKMGSGRAALWDAAWNRFTVSDLSGLVAGHGYQGMIDSIEQGTGARLHTHSDVFDMLLIGGCLGVVFIVVLVVDTVFMIRHVPPGSLMFGLGGAALAVFAIEGLLTGQMFFPDVMTAYLWTISMFSLLGSGTHVSNSPRLRA